MEPLIPLAAAALLSGADVSAALTISLPGNVERNVVQYDCEGLDAFNVDYVNAEPNFLALLPINGQRMVFVSVATGSGARYVAGQYEWVTKGSEAIFTDTMTADGQPVTCTEHSETP